MARVSFPRFGEIEGGPIFVAAILAMIAVSVLVGFNIWQDDDGTNLTPTSTSLVPTTLDEFDDFEDFEGPFDYGDDALLDSLFDGCDAGFFADCDDLYFESPVASEYEWFGATCGGRFDWNPGNCEGT